MNYRKLPDLSCFFILLSRENGEGAMRRANPDSLSSSFYFPSFSVEFFSDFLLLARFYQAETITGAARGGLRGPVPPFSK